MHSSSAEQTCVRPLHRATFDLCGVLSSVLTRAQASAAAAAPAAPAAPLAADDPRIAWQAQNNVAIQQRAQAEASKKVEVLAKAKEYLEKVNKVRLMVGWLHTRVSQH